MVNPATPVVRAASPVRPAGPIASGAYADTATPTAATRASPAARARGGNGGGWADGINATGADGRLGKIVSVCLNDTLHLNDFQFIRPKNRQGDTTRVGILRPPPELVTQQSQFHAGAVTGE
jgi:hypothetical protein